MSADGCGRLAQVHRKGDVDALQAVIETLTFADVEGEGERSLADANLVKLARLAQLCLEYLLHCQGKLEQQRALAVEDALRWQREVEKNRARYKEAKSLELLLQHWNVAPGGAEDASGGESLFRCHDGKLFVSHDKAEAHVRKRYPAVDCAALIAQIAAVPAPRPGLAGVSADLYDARAADEAAAAARAAGERAGAMAAARDAAVQERDAAQRERDALGAERLELRAQLVAAEHEARALRALSAAAREERLRAEHALELEFQRRALQEQLHAAEAARLREAKDAAVRALPPLPRTNRTSLVPPPLLSGHAASLRSASLARSWSASARRTARRSGRSARARRRCGARARLARGG
jgi:hypothetical protein